MIQLATEIGALVSPLIGAGAVLFFMRRDRDELDRRLGELKHGQEVSAEELKQSMDRVSSRLDRIETNQHRFELSLKDCVTWEELSKVDARIGEIDRRVVVLEEKCRTGLAKPGRET